MDPTSPNSHRLGMKKCEASSSKIKNKKNESRPPCLPRGSIYHLVGFMGLMGGNNKWGLVSFVGDGGSYSNANVVTDSQVEFKGCPRRLYHFSFFVLDFSNSCFKIIINGSNIHLTYFVF